MRHKSYKMKWGADWLVYHWDAGAGCYRESGISFDYRDARQEVAAANCPGGECCRHRVQRHEEKNEDTYKA